MFLKISKIFAALLPKEKSSIDFTGITLRHGYIALKVGPSIRVSIN